MTLITEPGFYRLSAATYFSKPVEGHALSQSRAKLLLDDAGPARFQHRMITPEPPRRVFDEGKAAHALVLGKGGEQLVEVDAPNYRSKDAQAARDAAYAAGLTPLLRDQLRLAEEMAEAIMKHPAAVEALQGEREISAYSRHESGIWLHGMLDVYAEGSHIADYKTARDASARGFRKAAWDHRYYFQAAWYRALVKELTGSLLPFKFIVQEKEPPYLVSVWEVSELYLSIGDDDMAEAIRIFNECIERDEWPGYPADQQLLLPPDFILDSELEGLA